MKTSKLLTLCGVLLLSSTSVVKSQGRKPPVPYPSVREADVMWKKRVWREIDLREKINHVLYFPTSPMAGRNSLFDVIRKGIKNSSLSVYGADDFLVRLTEGEIINALGDSISINVEDTNGDMSDARMVYEATTSQDIIKYWVKEDWFFDCKRSVMEVRIAGICPIKLKLNEDGSVRGIQQLFWVNFPEARSIFSEYEVFNRFNDAERMSYDDFFFKRMFNGYIIKESNVYGRFLSDYKTGVDLLLESDNVKNNIFIMEHDLWHY